jgi:lycopene beta-cyclase
MKEFDYIILGGGLSGLSLAYEMNRQGCLKEKTLCVIEKRKEYIRDKSWCYWDFDNNKFKDCVIKSWEDFSITLNDKTVTVNCNKTPYRAIDSKKFYEFTINQIKSNNNISIIMDCDVQLVGEEFIETDKGNYKGGFVFDSLIDLNRYDSLMYQHFFGCEIETEIEYFNDEIVDLMNFDCSQNGGLHFFYTLPFSRTKALIETTWYSKSIKSKEDYQNEMNDYLTRKKIVGKINYTEYGAIPLDLPFIKKNNLTEKYLRIGIAGNLTRASTGYTFQAIQTFSEQIANSMRLSNKIIMPHIRPAKYNFLDKIFLSVMKNNYKQMPSIFFNLFKSNNNSSIVNFLTDRSNWIEDFKILLSMPKFLFIKNFISCMCEGVFKK